MRKLLKNILKILAAATLKRYRPTVIGVTGSVGKTSTKEAIYCVLSQRFFVRKNEANFNNEFGVAFTILGIDPARFSAWTYKLVALLRAVGLAFSPIQWRYPRVLILELAADRPGDIGYLVNYLKPTIGVVTAVGELPVHVEFYAGPEAVAREKAKLIQALPSNGLAILNYDDQTVLDMKDKTHAKTVAFGFSDQANIWASDISYFVLENSETIGGLSFKIHQNKSFMPVRVKDLMGPHLVYALLAAASVGLHFGMNLIEIAEAMENFQAPAGRMKLLHGISNSIVIDDTYNASPASTHAALDALHGLAQAAERLHGKKPRTIAVLGDMRELGKYEEVAHRGIGDLVGTRADVLVTVGAAAKFMADSAVSQLSAEKIFSFSTSEAAKEKVKELIEVGDIVLVKGSHSMKMEKIVTAITT